MGCDGCNSGTCHSSAKFQSTHPRGVRLSRLCKRIRPKDFNPRTHVGCDRRGGNIIKIVYRFQSTHPRGVRPSGSLGRCRIKHISIHAPTWGATSFAPHCEPLDEFQSTHPRGVRRPNGRGCRGGVREFQSTHPRGVRLNPSGRRLEPRDFNPRTHVGCDSLVNSFWKLSKISIHAPTWGATRFDT